MYVVLYGSGIKEPKLPAVPSGRDVMAIHAFI